MTVGTPEENEFFGEALGRVLAPQRGLSSIGQGEAAVREAGEAELRAGHLGRDVFPKEARRRG